jgi:type IV pilus assembly protein PilW
MRSPAAHRLPRAMRGLSLVELMIGLAIGLVLSLGMVTMITGTSRGFRDLDESARMQEGAADALRYIGDSVRLAGFLGFGGAQAVQAILPQPAPGAGQEVDTLNDCGSVGNPPENNWALPTAAESTPIRGAANVAPAAVNGLYPCILETNFVGGTVLVTRGATGVRVVDPTPLTDLQDAPLVADTVYVHGDPLRGSILFRGGTARLGVLRAAGEVRTTNDGVNPINDAPVFEYSAHVYYVRPCSRPAAPPGCAATDDAGLPIPTLVRQQLQGRTMVEVPLVQGVERIGVLYGIDADGNGRAETQVLTPAAGDWANVVSVRVAVLMRSLTPRTLLNDAGKQYDLTAGNGVAFTCNPAVANDCQFQRRVFVQTFQVRNVAGRRGAI